MIVLTEEQHQALTHGTEPIHAIDRTTNVEYVLLHRETYDRLKDHLDTGLATEAAVGDVPVGTRQSKEAYLRALPALLRDSRFQRHWVAYAGQKRIGIAASETALYQECQKLGLHPDEVYMGMVVPYLGEPEAVDPSGSEFTESPA